MNIIELPDSLPPHDPNRREQSDDPGAGQHSEDPTNGARAQEARDRLETFWTNWDLDDLSDLMTNILHLAHQDGLDPFEVLQATAKNFLAEAGDLPPSADETADWQEEVANGDTKLGLADWIKSNRE